MQLIGICSHASTLSANRDASVNYVKLTTEVYQQLSARCNVCDSTNQYGFSTAGSALELHIVLVLIELVS